MKENQRPPQVRTRKTTKNKQTDYLRTQENKKGKNKWQNKICIKINIIYALKIFTEFTNKVKKNKY